LFYDSIITTTTQQSNINQKAGNEFSEQEIASAKAAMDTETTRVMSLIKDNANLDETSARIILTPGIDICITYLHTLGFTNEDLIEEFGSLQDPGIVMMGHYLNLGDNGYQTYGGTSTWDLIVDCAASAAGIAGVSVLLQTGIKNAIKQVGIKGVVKIVGKFLGKYLGWFGAALALIDFTECLTTGD
jgi:hypothetical protein